MTRSWMASSMLDSVNKSHTQSNESRACLKSPQTTKKTPQHKTAKTQSLSVRRRIAIWNLCAGNSEPTPESILE
jgi:hypothetical protein